MKKKMGGILAIFALVTGIVFAGTSAYKYHYKVYIHCDRCGANGTFDFDANSDDSAREKANELVGHGKDINTGKKCTSYPYPTILSKDKNNWTFK